MGMGIVSPVAHRTADELVELDHQPKKKLATTPPTAAADGFSRMSSEGVQLILGFLTPTDRASLLATQRKLRSEPLATSIQSYCGACAQCTAQNEHLCESSASEVDHPLFWKSLLGRRTNCLGLRQLRLANCPMFAKSLPAVRRNTNTNTNTNALQNLRVLELKRCVGVDADTLRTLASACGNLQELRLRDMALDTDAFAQLVSANQHSLRAVDLEGCHTLTGADVLALLACRRLTRLSLAGCHNVDSSAIAAIVRACDHLTSLNLRFCHQIDDQLVHTLAAARPHLEELSLRYCMKITDAAVRAIGDALPHLMTLDLSQCSKITDAGVGHIVARLKALKNLRLWACGKLTSAAVRAIMEASPSLELVDIRSRNRLEAVIGGRDGLQLLARKRSRRWEHGEQFGVFKRLPMCAVAA